MLSMLPIEIMDKIVLMSKDIVVCEVLKKKISNYAYENVIKNILIELIKKAGIDTLHLICKEQFDFKIKRQFLKNTRIPIEKRREFIINGLSKKIQASNIEKIKKTIEKYFPKKEKKIKTETDVNWLNDFQLGEEVLIRQKYFHQPHLKGYIHKINKKSVTVNLFKYKEKENTKKSCQDYTYYRLIWEPEIDKKVVIFSRDNLIKKGECVSYDKEFIEGEYSIDWGR